MLESQIIIAAVMAFYFICMIAMGVIGGRNESQDDFIIASRNVGIIPTAAVMAASFRDGMGLVFWFGIAATLGYGGIWLFIGIMMGMMLYVMIGPSMRAMAQANNFITIGEVIRSRIGKITERFSGIIIIMVALILVAAQLYVAGHVFSRALDLPSWIGIWGVAVVASVYLCLGGYSNVIKTDIVQFFIMLSLFLTVFFMPPPPEKVFAFDTYNTMGLKTSIALGVVGFFYVWCSADSWQRIFSARNDDTIRKAFPIAAVFLFALTLSLLFLGMAAAPKIAPGISSDLAFYELFNPGFIHPALQAFIAVVALAVCMSTLSPACYVSAATVARNLLPVKYTDSKESYIRFSRVVMLVIMAITATGAMMIGNVIEFLFGAVSIMYILFPVILASVLGGNNKGSRLRDIFFTASTAISSAVYFFMFMNGLFSDLAMTLVPVGLNTALIGAYILFNRIFPAHARA